ncbi:MAG: DUF2813 domain-containing protein [Gammaproteobacteria bacterium]|nr:DUF2813 domain-containing protein [Gammaproteobacteria bacterium]
MRLKSLWVDGFKNLNKFEIDFESRYGITVLIGNNASGKSNVLEAISAIFSYLYNDNLKDIPFGFDLVYKIKDLDVRVSKRQKVRFRIKKPSEKSWKELQRMYAYGNRLPTRLPMHLGEAYDYRPSQVIALYSGEELRLWENYYQKSYFNFNNTSLKSDTYLSEQKMLYVNKHYWDIALLTMYASSIDEIEKITQSKLKEIKLEVNVELLNNFSVAKPNNEVNSFVWGLVKLSDMDENDVPLISDKEFMSYRDVNAFSPIILNLEEFELKSDYKTHVDLFNLLCVARLPKDENKKLITNIELIFENERTTKDFSEGQKKQILLKFCLEVLADENSLLLFDEPDAHIHIANKKLIPEILKEHSNYEIILTTHSPTLAHSFSNKHLAYIENGKINEGYNTQEKLLNELTNGLMGISEQQLLLQSNKDILIVEGKTDEAYISQALKILKEDNLKYKDLEFNFLWLGGSDADTLNKIISGFTPKEGQTIIAFFDRDGAGKECVKKALGKKTLENDFDGAKKEEVYIYLYPRKDNLSNEVFVVEDYFPIKILREYILNKGTTFQSITRKFDKQKFAKKCEEDSFDKTNFNGFKVLFNKILKIKNLSSSTR